MFRALIRFGLVSATAAALLVSDPPTSARAQQAGTSTSDARTASIVVGKITENAKKHYPVVKRMATYLASRLDGATPPAGEGLITRDPESMARYLKDGRVDVISETPFTALRLAEKAGAEIILREWKKGVAEYNSVFFTRKDSGIETLADLVGRKIAFEDRGSTSAFLVPLAMLRRQGLELRHQGSPRDAVPKGVIGYSFALGELNIAAWVALGIVDAGAFSNLDWQEIVRTPERIKKDLRIFHESAPVLRSVVLVRPGLAPDKRRRIKETLLGMHRDSEGRAVLEAYYKVKQYDALTGAARESLEESRRMLDRIRGEVD